MSQLTGVWRLIAAGAALAGLTLAAASPAMAQFGASYEPPVYPQPYDAQLAGLDRDGLERALADAQLFRALGSSKQAIDGPSRCGPLIDDIQSGRELFDALQAQYRDNPTEDYRRRATMLQEGIDRDILYYQQCFAENLSGFDVVTAQGIISFAAHRDRYAAMQGAYAAVGDMNAFIAEIQRRIAEMDQPPIRDIQGPLITAVWGEVEYSLGGTRPWRPLNANMLLAFNDQIRTGPDGGATLYYVEIGQPRSVTVNLAANTHIRIGDIGARDLVSVTAMDLLNGAMRVFARSRRGNSRFWVQTGLPHAGIRGTEIAISYDAQTDSAQYVLDHGDAFFDLGDGVEVPIQPRTAISLERAQVVSVREISDDVWAGVVQRTGGAFVTPAVATETAPAPTAALPQAPDNWASTVSASFTRTQAYVVVESFLLAMQSANSDNVLAFAGGRYRETLNRIGQERNLQEFFEQSAERPESIDMGCTACLENGECWTEVRVIPVGGGDAHLAFISRPSAPGASDMLVEETRPWDDQIEAAFAAMTKTCY